MLKTSKHFDIICSKCNSSLVRIGVTSVMYGASCEVIIVCGDCNTVENVTEKIMQLSKRTLDNFIKGLKVKKGD